MDFLTYFGSVFKSHRCTVAVQLSLVLSFLILTLFVAPLGTDFIDLKSLQNQDQDFSNMTFDELKVYHRHLELLMLKLEQRMHNHTISANFSSSDFENDQQTLTISTTNLPGSSISSSPSTTKLSTATTSSYDVLNTGANTMSMTTSTTTTTITTSTINGTSIDEDAPNFTVADAIESNNVTFGNDTGWHGKVNAKRGATIHGRKGVNFGSFPATTFTTVAFDAASKSWQLGAVPENFNTSMTTTTTTSTVGGAPQSATTVALPSTVTGTATVTTVPANATTITTIGADVLQQYPAILPTEDSSVSTSTPITQNIHRFPQDEALASGLEYLKKSFNATKCVQLTQEQLIRELKEKGTFNPDFMAWDVRGVLHFLEKMNAKYEEEPHPKGAKEGSDSILERNVFALERLLKELNIQGCSVDSPDVLARLYNFTKDLTDSSKNYGRLRTKRSGDDTLPEILSTYRQRVKYIRDLYNERLSRDDSSQFSDDAAGSASARERRDPETLGNIHIVPFGCHKRGSEDDGYLRMCGSCQAIRRMPDTFFPPYINEVVCDEDKACLYFYDYPHGKCKQKHMNFVVLQNVGSAECQIWKKFNINVRVCCECFVDEKSFFAKYV